MKRYLVTTWVRTPDRDAVILDTVDVEAESEVHAGLLIFKKIRSHRHGKCVDSGTTLDFCPIVRVDILESTDELVEA